MTIPTSNFGRTGHQSTRVIFGGAALGEVDQRAADQALELLLTYGINHIDVASRYGDAELRIKPWLAAHPGHFFVATKAGERTAAGARAELHRSLERMGVDHIDLWQLHSLADPSEWDIALSPGGALEAGIEAREQGLVSWLGVTGHGVQIAASHRRSLERFDFDSVLLPCNYLTLKLPYYASNFESLLATCRERNVAVQTIKSLALGPWAGREHTHSTWYKPFEDQDDIDRAVWWVLARSQVFLNSAGDLTLLPKVLDAANRFQAGPSDSEMDALVERAKAEPLFV